MAAALVQHLGSIAYGSSSTTTVISPSSKTVTVGNTIIVAARWSAAMGTPSVADNLGNTYTKDANGGQSGSSVAALFSAPVTTGGSLTTITVTHASATYRAATAAEFSGVGTVASDGGATYGNSTTATWDNSVTIPANGLAVGAAFTENISTTHAAGSASGSPSTAITMDDWRGDAANFSSSFHHAIAGGSDVTSFSGTATFATDYWKAVGANYNPAGTPARAGDIYELESGGSYGYQLEDASGVLLIDAPANAPAGAVTGTGTVAGGKSSLGGIAGAVAGTGTAGQARAGASAAPSAVAGTGTARQPTVQAFPVEDAAAGAATGTGTAGQPTKWIGTYPAAATGTGAANQPTVQTFTITEAQAGLASGASYYGGAFDPGFDPGFESYSPTTASIGSMPPVTAGTGTAPQPTVTTLVLKEVSAGAVTATGTAQQARANPGGIAGAIARTGAANTATASEGAIAGSIARTGTASQPAVFTQAYPTSATGTGTANQVRASIGASWPQTAYGLAQGGVGEGGVATGSVSIFAGSITDTGSAPQPSVQTSAGTNAQAGAVTGTGTAGQPTASVGITGGANNWLGQASGFLIEPNGDFGERGGILEASIGATPTSAAGTAIAWQPTVTTQTGTSVDAGLAGGVGTAYQPAIEAVRSDTGGVGRPKWVGPWPIRGEYVFAQAGLAAALVRAYDAKTDIFSDEANYLLGFTDEALILGVY